MDGPAVAGRARGGARGKARRSTHEHVPAPLPAAAAVPSRVPGPPRRLKAPPSTPGASRSHHELQTLDRAAPEGDGADAVITTQQAVACFAMLDEVLPQLGPLQRVVGLIRDELFDLVFSRRYTAGDAAGQLQRVPFFAVLSQLEKQRNKKAQACLAQAADIQHTLDMERLDHGRSQSRLQEAATAAEARDAELALAREAGSRAETDCEARLRAAAEREVELARQLQRLNARVASLENELKAREAQVQQLRPFQTLYTSLESGFAAGLAKRSRDSTPAKQEPSVRGVFRSTLEHSRRTRAQLCRARNRALADYEAELQGLGSRGDEELLVGGGQEGEAEEEVSSSVVAARTRFSSWMGGFDREIRGHCMREAQLLEQLQRLSSRDPRQFAVRDQFHPQDCLRNNAAVAVNPATDSDPADGPVSQVLLPLIKDELPSSDVGRELSEPELSRVIAAHRASVRSRDAVLNAEEVEPPVPALLSFLKARYVNGHTAALAARDLGRAVDRFGADSENVSVFAATLLGGRNLCEGRYLSTLLQLAACVEWTSTLRFADFARGVFPAQSEDGQDVAEALKLEYEAFCKGTASLESAQAYCTHLVHQGSDPTFQLFEARAAKHGVLRSSLSSNDLAGLMQELGATAAQQTLAGKLCAAALRQPFPSNTQVEQVMSVAGAARIAAYVWLQGNSPAFQQALRRDWGTS